MKRSKLCVLLLLICLLLSSCSSKSPQLPKIENFNTISLGSFERESNEDARILYANSSKILVNISFDYQEGDPAYHEVGLNSQTKYLAIYNTENLSCISCLDVNEREYCISGILLQDDVVYSAVYYDVQHSAYEYRITRVSKDDQRTIIEQGACPGTGYDEPYLKTLGADVFAYSYHNISDNTFGVNIVLGNNNIEQQLRLEGNNGAEHFMSLFRGNGFQYVYYAKVDGKGTVFVGDADGIQHQFCLDEGEQIYDYCFLNDAKAILFTKLGTSASHKDDQLVIRSLEGTLLGVVESGPCYRLESDNLYSALCINEKYQPHLITVSEDMQNIQIDSLDISSQPMLFYSIAPAKFLIHNYTCLDDTELLSLFGG